MKLLEIHKNGINAHNNEVSFYGIDFQTKTLMFDGIENVECAIEIVKELGYKISEIHMFIDEVGATRHAISDKELNELYKRLENFIADCTVEEAKESRDAFVKVQTMIYQRMRETKK